MPDTMLLSWPADGHENTLFLLISQAWCFVSVIKTNGWLKVGHDCPGERGPE